MNTSKKKQVVIYSFTFTVVMALLIFFVYKFNIPNPNMILIAALVVSTTIGGWIPGAICSVMMMTYSLFFFSIDNSFIHFNEDNMYKIIVIFIGVVINIVSVALLKSKDDKNDSKLISINEELNWKNTQLLEKTKELTKVNDLLKSMAYKDTVTDLRNRYALKQDLKMYTGLDLHIFFLDLDNFKLFNDSNGHAYGDKILNIVGKTLKDNFRTSNCYRYGGDEFLIVCENEPDTDFYECCQNAKKQLIEHKISFSGGYIYGTPMNLLEFRNMVMQADEMLYKAKNEGKNILLGKEYDKNYSPSSELTIHTARYDVLDE